ncbi:MAG TPA: hypothetical protein VG297_04350 [Bryobacteraceae bacterium]|jgi:hypothetical protein|nr:hypothetical protein [Bryobacteraceae bacterium]
MHDFLNSVEQSSLSIWIRESGSIWSFPTILLLHTLGMSIVAGGSAIVDLVLLGFWPVKMSVRPLDKYFPLIWAGFWLNAVTGTLLLMADATAKLTNTDFYVKMAFIFAGVAVLYQMRRKVFADPLLDRGVVSGTAKGLAWASLICWFAAITAGRLLAYVGPVSGPPGLSNK